jgi:hypothetical protein
MRVSVTRAVFHWLLFCCLQTLSVNAQQLRCDVLRPLLGSASQYRERGNRCEGLYVVQVGSRSIDVISFTLGRVMYDLESKRPLQLSVPSQVQFVNIRAVAIPPKTYYRMDAILARGAVLTWPITDVLVPEHLTDDRIGIFAWSGTEDGKTFIPVKVATDPSSPGTRTNDPTLMMQTSFDAQQIKWRWGPAQGDGCGVLAGWQDAIQHPIEAGWPTKIILHLLPEGLNCVEVAARSRASNWTTLKVRVEMPRP